MNISTNSSRIMTQFHAQHVQEILKWILPLSWLPHLTQREQWRWVELLPKLGFCRMNSNLVNWIAGEDWGFMGIGTLTRIDGESFIVCMSHGRFFSRKLGAYGDTNRFDVLWHLENGCRGFPSLSSDSEHSDHWALREELHDQAKVVPDFGVLLSLGELYLSKGM